jgi:phospholipid/cholesterol/gamma-HCH transport system ATP-binding protein
MSQSFISFQHVDKSFGSQVVFSDFSLDVNKGETLSIIGPSGVGKTVSIKLLIGLLDPDAGEIWFDGVQTSAFSKDEEFFPMRRRVAMVFQGSALFDSLNVYENISYPLREQSKLKESEIKTLVEEKLEWVGLPGTETKMPAELSGGMKKRIGLARAIVTSPEVILYDEPTAGLDPINTHRIVDLIISLQEKLKCTSIVVTHDISSASRLSDRAAFMYDRKIRAVGKLEDLMQSGDKYVRGFLAGDPSLADR